MDVKFVFLNFTHVELCVRVTRGEHAFLFYVIVRMYADVVGTSVLPLMPRDATRGKVGEVG